jgi:integrase
VIKARIRKRDGRTVYDARLYEPGTKKLYGQTFETKKAARAWEAAQRTAQNQGVWIDPRRGDLTCNQLCDLWLASNPAKRKRSVQTDRDNLKHFRSMFGTRRVQSMTKADFQRLVDTLKMTHSPSTVARIYSSVRATFSYAVDAEIITHSNCRKIRLPQVSQVDRPVVVAEKDSEHSTMTMEELDRLADELGPDWAPWLWTSLILGSRWGETMGLTVGDLNLLRKEITITTTLDRDRELVSPKTATSRRSLHAPQWLMNRLSALLARRGLTGADGDALVFVNTKGGAISHSPWRRQVWRSACEGAGVKLTPQDLRSMTTSAMAAVGVDLKTMQHRLGHAVSRTITLDVYARPSPEADQRAADLLGEVFLPRAEREARIGVRDGYAMDQD